MLIVHNCGKVDDGACSSVQAVEKELAGSIQKGVDFVAGGGKK